MYNKLKDPRIYETILQTCLLKQTEIQVKNYNENKDTSIFKV